VKSCPAKTPGGGIKEKRHRSGHSEKSHRRKGLDGPTVRAQVVRESRAEPPWSGFIADCHCSAFARPDGRFPLAAWPPSFAAQVTRVSPKRPQAASSDRRRWQVHPGAPMANSRRRVMPDAVSASRYGFRSPLGVAFIKRHVSSINLKRASPLRCKACIEARRLGWFGICSAPPASQRNNANWGQYIRRSIECKAVLWRAAALLTGEERSEEWLMNT